MKKAILLLATTALLTACAKKNYTCTCQCTPTSGTAFTKTGTISNTTLSDANSKCGAYGQAAVNGNGTWNCSVQ
jgi:hypothetical protein